MILGIDIGGTKTLIGAFTNEGKLTECMRFETPAAYSDFLQEFQKMFLQMKDQDFKAGTVAAPGKIVRDSGIVTEFGNLKWHNTPIGKDISGITRCPIYIENDANLAGLSEALALTPPQDKVLYVTISTSIGNGVIENGLIDKALEDSEAGFMMLSYEGKLQAWESFASGRAIVRQFGKRASEITDSRDWVSIANNIAIGLVELCAVIEPGIIIIGGGVGAHYKKFEQPMMTYLHDNLPHYIRRPKIVGAQHAEQASLIGCYEFTRQKLDGRA